MGDLTTHSGILMALMDVMDNWTDSESLVVLLDTDYKFQIVSLGSNRRAMQIDNNY